MRDTISLFLRAGIALLFTGFASAAVGGAVYLDNVRQFMDRVVVTPSLRDQPVTVIVEADSTSVVKGHVVATGGTLRYRAGRRHEVILPGGKLSELIGRLPSSYIVRFPYPHQALSVTSQGVALTGAGDMQAIGNNGAGIKVGVIDLGFASLSNAQVSGDLPANLSIVDYTGTGTGGINHGTNVAQIVYDMAPGAQLYLAKVNTDVQLQQAVADMIAAGVRVINHSVAWYGAAFYDGTGPICDTVNQAEANNVQWVNAMGNDRYRHYMALFTDSNNDRRHEFATGQNYNTVALTAGATYQFVLNWDAYPTTSVDYDLYLYNGNPDSGGTVVASSANRQGTLYPYPYEYFSYTPSVNGTYYLVVRKFKTSTPNLRFALFSFGVDLAIGTTTSSLAQPADCSSVISVGATNLNDVPEYFSSEGPTTDGRSKPDISGPDGVTTSLATAFYGTSGAAPHVAGATALLVAQNPTFTLAQIKWLLTGTAKDVNTAGYDYRTGSGRISLDADGDGFNHDTDNCRLASNPDQVDMDHDGIGDACDDDIDGDGLTNVQEAAIGTNPRNPDTDGDGLSDYAEVCYDGDCTKYTSGKDLNPLSRDTDGDGIPDGSDPTPLVPNNDGDVAPLGSPNGVVDAADYMVAMRIVLGQVPVSGLELSHGDLYPIGAPDGTIDLSDLVLILQKVRQ